MLKFKVILIRINSQGQELREEIKQTFESKYAAKKFANNRLNKDEYFDDFDIIEIKD